MIDIAALVDLTLLKGDETEESIAALCSKAVKHHVAAVCVYPEWVARCVELLTDNSGVKVASVVNFPHGDDTLQETLSVIEKLKKDGADEVDVVLPYHRWLNGDREYAKKFISKGNKVKRWKGKFLTWEGFHPRSKEQENDCAVNNVIKRLGTIIE